MQYYTYKITFKDLPGYFYYGKHKDNGKLYYGSPVTWACFWTLFEPEIQILQRYETAEEAMLAEKAIIDATWGDKYSLNEHNGYAFSEEVCKKNGMNNGIENGMANLEAMNRHENTAANRSRQGKKTGSRNGSINILVCNSHPNTRESQKNNGFENIKACHAHPNTKANSRLTAKAMNEHPNAKLNRERIAEENRKQVLLTKIDTGERLVFASFSEAARTLGLNRGHLGDVARGTRRQHKGYTASYV